MCVLHVIIQFSKTEAHVIVVLMTGKLESEYKRTLTLNIKIDTDIIDINYNTPEE